MGIAFIVTGTLLLFYLALKGHPVVVAAPLCAVIVAAGNGQSMLDAFSVTYVKGVAAMLTVLYPILLLGGLIAEFYRAGGGAASIANALYNLSKRVGKTGESPVAVTYVVINLIGLVLVYGGINSVVATVIIFPIALEIFKNADLPREISAGAVLSGTVTAGIAMPGSPQFSNVIPMQMLGTPSTAGLVPGVAVGVFMVALNVAILTFLTKKELRKGNRFTSFEGMPAAASGKLPNPWLSATPLIVVFILFHAFKVHVNAALFAGVVAAGVFFLPYYGGVGEIKTLFTKGGVDAGSLTLIGASLAAYAGVVSSMPPFADITSAMINLPGPPVVKAAVAMMLVTGFAGSGPAGVTAGISIFGDTFKAMGVSLNALHRVASFASVSLATMPSNAAVNVAAKLSGFPVAKTYLYIFFMSVFTTSIGTILVALWLQYAPGMA